MFQKPCIAFDVETTGINLHDKQIKIFAYSLSDETGNISIVRLTEKNSRKKLQDLLDNTNISKVAHNLKFDLFALYQNGFSIPENTVFHDTMIMNQCLNNLRNFDALDDITYSLSGYICKEDKLVKQYAKRGFTYDKIPVSIMNPYQRADAERTILLYLTFKEQFLKENNQLQYLDYLNEIELIKSTILMEKRGLLLDAKKCNNMIQHLQNEIQETHNFLYKTFKQDFNLSSGKQVQDLLFNRLKLTATKKSKSGNNFATDKEVLFELREQYSGKNVKIIDTLNHICKHRSYTKGISNIETYLDCKDSENIIHPNIHTNIAKTGRQSVTNPPLQCVSKRETIFNPFPVKARELFRCRPNFINFMPDYAGIEMRLLTHVSNDTNMIDVFKQNLNPHKIATEIFYGSKYSEETDSNIKAQLYGAGKNAHFALPYGANFFKISKILGLGVFETKSRFDIYKNRFPRLATISRILANEARENGFVVTSFGRKLFIQRNKEFTAINYMIQGTGAGILKRAINKISKYSEKFNGKLNMLFTVHDEIIFEMSRELLKNKKEILSEINFLMTDFPEFSIPLEVEFKYTSTNWGEGKIYEHR